MVRHVGTRGLNATQASKQLAKSVKSFHLVALATRLFTPRALWKVYEVAARVLVDFALSVQIIVNPGSAINQGRHEMVGVYCDL